MKKAYKLIGSFLRTLPSGEHEFYEHDSELDDLTEVEVQSLGNKLVPIKGVVEPADLRSGIDPEPEDDEELDPSPVEEVEPEDDDEEPEDDSDDSDGSDDADSDADSDAGQGDEDDEDTTSEKASHLGGGWWVLPNGDKVHGKDNIPEQWR